VANDLGTGLGVAGAALLVFHARLIAKAQATLPPPASASANITPER
jgi:hypothetical protein